MSGETKAAFENMRFYKFYPMPSPDTPDVSNVKVILCFFLFFFILSVNEGFVLAIVFFRGRFRYIGYTVYSSKCLSSILA